MHIIMHFCPPWTITIICPYFIVIEGLKFLKKIPEGLVVVAEEEVDAVVAVAVAAEEAVVGVVMGMVNNIKGTTFMQ